MTQVLVLFLMNIGTAIGLSLMMLCYWFITLYNLGPVEPKSTLALSLIILSFLLFFTYWLAVIQYTHANDVIGVFALTASSFTNLLVMSGVRLEDVKDVPVGRYKLLALTSIMVVIGFLIEVLVFPEAATGDLRSRMARVLAEMEHMCAFGTFTRESVSRMKKSHDNVLLEVGSMKMDMKSSSMDFGWFYDAPSKLVQVANALIRTTHHLGSLIHALEQEVAFGGSPPDDLSRLMTRVAVWVRKAVIVVHDALVTKPGIVGMLGLTAHDKIVPIQGKFLQSDDFSRVKLEHSEIIKESNHYLEKMQDSVPDSWSRVSIAFTLGSLQMSTEDLVAAMEQVWTERPAQAKFWSPLQVKRVKLAKHHDKTPRTKHELSWYCNEAMYAIFRHFGSDASHFATKKAIVMFLIAVWAYVPSTSVWFAENNGFWILIAALLMVSPTLGATLGKVASRLIGSGIGIAWAILAFAVGGREEGLTLLFAIPLVLVSLYLQNCTKQTYAGMVMLLTYNVIAFSRNKVLQDACFRALFQILGCTIAVLAAVFVYPMFSRVDVRSCMGNVLHNIAELFQRTLFVPNVSTDVLSTTAQAREATGLFGASQGLLTKTSLTLHDAAAEPDVDRPYDQSVMEALQATMQHLIYDFTSLVEVETMMRSNPANVVKWNEMMDKWRGQQTEFIHSLSFYLNTLAATLLNKTPLPVQSPSIQCRRFLDDLTTLPPVDGLVGFMCSSVIATYQSTVADVELLEELLMRIYGRMEWYTSDAKDEEIGLLTSVATQPKSG